MARYLYVTEAKLLEDKLHAGGSLQSLWRLFKEAHYIRLDDKHILISADFNSDWHQQAWHLHPGVGRLQHPANEAGIPLAHLHGGNWAHKKFTDKHCGALTSKLGIDCATATVHDIHKAAILLNPQVRIDSGY